MKKRGWQSYSLVGLAAVMGAGLALLRTAPPAPATAAKAVAVAQPAAHTVDSDPPAWVAGAVPVPPRHTVPENDRLGAAPAFEEIADGRFQVQTNRYYAMLSAADGLVYRPLPDRSVGPAGRRDTLVPPQDTLVPSEQTPELRVRLTRVTRGSDAIFDSASDADAETDVPVTDETGGLSFWRAPGFEERYTPRGDGVEQSFLLETRPKGKGPLTFRCDLVMRGLTALPPRAARRGGLLFVDAEGRFAARYGQVVVRDSRQQGLVLEPALSADGRSVSFAVPAQWLDAAQYPVLVDPLVGADFPLTSDNGVGVAPPLVAAGNNNYLVAWNDYRAGASQPQIVACIVSASGLPSAEFALSPATGLPQDFRGQRTPVAFDGSNWLVVWSDDRAVGPGVRGCMVSSAGAVSMDFLIASTPGTVLEDPLVAFNGSDFIVAWQSPPASAAGGSQIYYTRVASTGTVDAPLLVPSDFTPINQALLFLAPQKPSGDTLLVYRDTGETPAQTRSVRIALDASLRDPGGTALFKENMAEGGFGRAIGAAFVDTAWHILSSFDQLEDSAVYLHKLDTAGLVTPPAGVFAEVGLGPTGMTLDQYAPAFAGAGEWLFVRNEKINNTVYHLLGKRVTFAGEDKDPLLFQIDTATQGILRSAVAAQVGNAFLVTWLDGRVGTTQPADAKIIAAAIVDATSAGTAGTPLLATVSASPTSGEAPLSVLFDAAASTGSYDTLTWDFGDGTTAAQAQVTHTYRNNGTYVAQLKLTKGAYSVFDTAVIIVGGGGSVGPGGGTAIGMPVQCTPGLEPRLFLSAIAFKLDFVNTNKDIFRVAGIVDVGQLPDALTGLAASIAVGAQNFAFNLDAKGGYKSDPSVDPVLSFVLNPATGAFTFQAVDADLRATMDALGARDETVTTRLIVAVPVTVTLDKFSVTATQGVVYRATQDVWGAGNYGYLGAGDEISGSFLIGKFSALEETRAKDGVKVHSFSIKGQVKRPNGDNFRPGDTGEFSFTIGNYTVGIPAGQFRAAKGITKYVGRVGVSGLKKFSLDFNSGVFNLQLLKVPAEGIGGSGVPLAKSGTDIAKVDLNLSFQFDLADGAHFSAGRYVYIARKTAATKNWKPR